MIKIPSDGSKLFVQRNDSDILGTIFATMNCDFDINKGSIHLGKRLIVNMNTADIADLAGYPVGFKVFDNGTGEKIYTACGVVGAAAGTVLQGGVDPTQAFTSLRGTGAPTACDSSISDLEVFNGKLYVTADTQHIYSLNVSNSWSDFSSTSTVNGFPRPLCVFKDRMYSIIHGYQVISFDTSNTVAAPSASNSNTNSFCCNLIDSASTTDLPIASTFIRASASRLWIGTVSLIGGKGYVYAWEGSTPTPTAAYRLQSTGALACVIFNDTPYIIDSNGDFLYWNGGTFLKLTGFNRRMKKQFINPSAKANNRFIHPNGMAVIDGKIHILVDLTNNDATGHAGTQEYCNPSGVYVYDEDTKSLRHKYSIASAKAAGLITDYGQFRIKGAGGIAEMVTNKDYPTNISNGSILVGADYYTDATTSTSGIFYDDTNDTLAKNGYFIIPKIFSDQVADKFRRAFLIHQKFLNSTDNMIVKYRSVDETPTETTITWTTTTSFTYPNSFPLYAIGDEVEVIQGIGSGKCSKITNIQAGSGTYIVTVDKTYTGATGTSKARLMKWILAGTINDLKSFGSANFGEGITNPWIMLKIIMDWVGNNEFNELMIINETQQFSS